MKSINEIFDELEEKYGKQNWWPCISNNRRFEIIIGAILTQNTSWTNVEKAIKNLEKFNFLRKDAIKQLNEEELGELIRSSGYYKQKAKKIKVFVNFKGKINRENLLNLWGIGPETADSILAYAYNQKIFVVDTYTKRIFSRLGLKENKYDEIQDLVHHTLSSKYFNEFHALLVHLAKDHCKTKSKCDGCPLGNICLGSLT